MQENICMERTPRARSLTATARASTSRSDSRKRGRRSESPELPSGRIKSKLSNKKPKRTSYDKEQTKITSFSETHENDTLDLVPLPTENKTKTNMADNQQQFNTLMEQFEKMNTKFDTKFDEVIKRMDDRMDKIESKVLEVENKLDNTVSDVKTLGERVDSSNERVVETQHSASLALSYAENNEQYQRNFNIRIFNLPESNDETIEDCEKKVLAFFADTLGVDVAIDAIDNLHRLGVKTKTKTLNNNLENVSQQNERDNVANESDEAQNVGMETGTESTNAGTEQSQAAQADVNKASPRPVIVSFVSRRVRRQILHNRFKLKKKDGQTSAPIIIVEDLTKQRHTLFAKARENKDKFKKVWSQEGKIYARQQNGLDVQITCLHDIICPPLDRRPPRRNYTFGGWRGRGGSFRGRGGRFSLAPNYTQQGAGPRDDSM